METKERCDKACEVLQKTHDGDNLDPRDLWLVQEAVNGNLNEKGYAAFSDLHKKVASGDYTKPWFHGIENLTTDQSGYVLWKGKIVEHYDSPFRWSDRGKQSAIELASRCRHLESVGVEPSVHTAVWKWKEYALKQVQAQEVTHGA